MAKIIFDIKDEDKAAFQRKCYKEDVSIAHVRKNLDKNYNKQKK